jgi:L-amino acid N-acyltransferase YncA
LHDVLIRKLETGDAAELLRCRLSGLQESPAEFLVTYAEVESTPVSQMKAELLDPDIAYVGAFSGNELVGFMRFVRFQRHARQHVAEVRSVYVRNDMRGQKIAARLLLQLIPVAKAAGIESLVLAVLDDNLPAKRLYESCGFRLYGTEPRAIKKPDGYKDQALYCLALDA